MFLFSRDKILERISRHHSDKGHRITQFRCLSIWDWAFVITCIFFYNPVDLLFAELVFYHCFISVSDAVCPCIRCRCLRVWLPCPLPRLMSLPPCLITVASKCVSDVVASVSDCRCLCIFIRWRCLRVWWPLYQYPMSLPPCLIVVASVSDCRCLCICMRWRCLRVWWPLYLYPMTLSPCLMASVSVYVRRAESAKRNRIKNQTGDASARGERSAAQSAGGGRGPRVLQSRWWRWRVLRRGRCLIFVFFVSSRFYFQISLLEGAGLQMSKIYPQHENDSKIFWIDKTRNIGHSEILTHTVSPTMPYHYNNYPNYSSTQNEQEATHLANTSVGDDSKGCPWTESDFTLVNDKNDC